MTTTINARCKCGNIQFSSQQKPVLQLVCHCDDCREASGNDFTTTAFFLVDSTSIVGELSSRAFTAATGVRTSREFCADCHSLLFDKSERFPTLIGVIAQTIEPPFEATPSGHVWTASKLPHISISDDLPQHSKDLA